MRSQAEPSIAEILSGCPKRAACWQADLWQEVKEFLENALRRLVAGGLAGLEIRPGRPTLAPDTENLVFFKFQTGSSIFS